jgi:hypothetical protein
MEKKKEIAAEYSNFSLPNNSSMPYGNTASLLA